MVIRLTAGVILLLGIGVIAAVVLGGDPDPTSETAAATPATSEPGASASIAPPSSASSTIAEPENYGPRKALVNLDGWLNTSVTSLDDLDGKVVLVEMWTFGCFNCKARIPHNQELYAALPREEFEIVGVHAPEFAYEAEVANIEEAINTLGVTWPVALDTNKENFRAWQEGGRRFWPRAYVIDQNGDVRFDHIGEGKYDELEETITYLLDNPPAPTDAS